MNKPATSVIKNDDVKVGGKLRLGSAMTSAGPQSTTAMAQGHHSVSGASARLVRTAGDHAVVEVTCPCGAKTVLRCNF
jgi:hypothetical protein